MNVLVVGANGQLGAACCRALAAEGHVVRGSVRELSRPRGSTSAGLSSWSRTSPATRTSTRCSTAWMPSCSPPTPPRLAPATTSDRFAAGRGAPRGGRRPARRAARGAPVGTGHRRRRPGAARRRAATARAAGPRPRCPGRSCCGSRRSWRCGWRSSAPPCRCVVSRTPPRAAPRRPCVASAGSPGRSWSGAASCSSPVRRRIARRSSPSPTWPLPALPRWGAPRSAGETLDVAGPEVLSWAQVADIFSRVLGRRVRAVSTPTAVFARPGHRAGPGRPRDGPHHGAQPARRGGRDGVAARRWRARRPRGR